MHCVHTTPACLDFGALVEGPLEDADITEMGGSASAKKIDPYVLAISIFAVACLAVAGTAVALYLEVMSTPFRTVRIMSATAYCHATLTIPEAGKHVIVHHSVAHLQS